MQIKLPPDQKMTVKCRVEGGCLGPTGDDLVSGFCDFVQSELSSWEVDLLSWKVTPRSDNSLPELQYKLAGRNLSHEQAKRYLKSFNKNIDELEAEIHETLIVLIDEYMNKQ